MEDYMNNDAEYMTGVATDMAGKAGAMSWST